jgi:hypothetical protein
LVSGKRKVINEKDVKLLQKNKSNCFDESTLHFLAEANK